MLSDKIKTYRKENNLTQEEFAAKLFVSRNAVSKWENNNGYPSIDTLKDIAKLLNTSLDDLLIETDIKKGIKYKQYFLNILVFISYLFVSILIPDILLNIDPTAGIAYCLIIGPITFIILGMVTPFYNKNMLHSFIASALSISIILIYFEVATNMVMSGWEIFYYILFITSYCLMLKIHRVNLKDNINKIIYMISLSLIVLLSISYLILCIISLLEYNESYSAPIYVGPLIYTLVFIIPLTFCVLVYIYFKKKIRSE